MSLNRRDFLKTVGVAGGTLVASDLSKAFAAEGPSTAKEFSSLLIDTTLCGGCRSCEAACNEANKLPLPEVPFDDESVFEKMRTTDTKAFTVLNRFPNPQSPDEPVFVRQMCRHCNQPACASACLVWAMTKTQEGPVVWNERKCMGCRYCMLSCPYDIPKFEYDKAIPRILKCSMCFQRQKQGEIPACAKACPTGATLFGKRRELVEIARKRIYTEPEKYVHHLYGEHEVGGTGVLYLSSVPFEQLGFKMNLGTTPYPELTKNFLNATPLVFILWPAVLLGLHTLTKRSADNE